MTDEAHIVKVQDVTDQVNAIVDSVEGEDPGYSQTQMVTSVDDEKGEFQIFDFQNVYGPQSTFADALQAGVDNINQFREDVKEWVADWPFGKSVPNVTTPKYPTEYDAFKGKTVVDLLLAIDGADKKALLEHLANDVTVFDARAEIEAVRASEGHNGTLQGESVVQALDDLAQYQLQSAEEWFFRQAREMDQNG